MLAMGPGANFSNIGLIWPRLVWFTPSRALEMRPGWPRLALRSLVGGVPDMDSFGPRVASFGLCCSTFLGTRGRDRDARFPPSRERRGLSGVRRSGKLLILFRFVPFRSIPCRLRGDDGWGSGVAKLLFRLQLVAFRCIPDCPNPHPSALPEGEGIFLPSRERRHGFAETTHTTNVRLAGLWRNGQLSSLGGG